MGRPFRHRLRVRYHECDPQGVVFNAHYLAYTDICFTELWRALVDGYAGMTAQGIEVVVAEARVRFLAPLRFDEEFEMSFTVTRLGTTAMESEIAFSRDGEPIAEVAIAHVFVEGERGEKIPIPDEIRNGLASYEAAG